MPGDYTRGQVLLAMKGIFWTCVNPPSSSGCLGDRFRFSTRAQDGGSLLCVSVVLKTWHGWTSNRMNPFRNCASSQWHPTGVRIFENRWNQDHIDGWDCCTVVNYEGYCRLISRNLVDSLIVIVHSWYSQAAVGWIYTISERKTWEERPLLWKGNLACCSYFFKPRHAFDATEMATRFFLLCVHSCFKT